MRPPCAGGIGAALHLSSPATTALLDRLERAGHIERRPDPRDRRRVQVVMRPSAEELTVAFFTPLGRALQEVVAGLANEEVEIVQRFIAAAATAVDGAVGT